MIRPLLKRAINGMGRKFDYDVTYFHDVLDSSLGAGLRLALFPGIVRYRGPRQGHEVSVGATLASALEGDCGPCTQLVIDMALAEGVSPQRLRACLDADWPRAGAVGLGFRFAQAAIAGAPDLATLATEIDRRHGHQTRIAASFAAASGRFYPVFKRGLGYGATCQHLTFGPAKQAEIAQNDK